MAQTLAQKCDALGLAWQQAEAIERSLIDPADPGGSLAEGETHADKALGLCFTNHGGKLIKTSLRSWNDGAAPNHG